MSEPEKLGNVLFSVGTLPSAEASADNHHILLEALQKFNAGDLNEEEFISVHYEWIYDNVLSFYKRQPPPVKTDEIKRLELGIASISKNKELNGDERSIMEAWCEYLNRVRVVNQTNDLHKKWLKGMLVYFQIKGFPEKANVVRKMVFEHNQPDGAVDWKNATP